jgi:hypothetical protein
MGGKFGRKKQEASVGQCMIRTGVGSVYVCRPHALPLPWLSLFFFPPFSLLHSRFINLFVDGLSEKVIGMYLMLICNKGMSLLLSLFSSPEAWHVCVINYSKEHTKVMGSSILLVKQISTSQKLISILKITALL